MDWLIEYFASTPYIKTICCITFVCALGILLGKIKIFGISLGITFVFFVGIFLAYVGVDCDPQMLQFAENFGLILFIYTLGLQVGPGFFSSLKSGGIILNLLALGVILIGTALTIGLHFITDISMPQLSGIFAGAVTCTPSLGSAQESVRAAIPDDPMLITNMSTGWAVNFPVSIIAVILVMIFFRSLSSKKKVDNTNKKESNKKTTFVAEYVVINPAITGKTIEEIAKLYHKHFIITRIWREGDSILPKPDEIILENDHLIVISSSEDVALLKTIFGSIGNADWNKKDINWEEIDAKLVSKKIVITKPGINGTRLESLRLRNDYGVNITRVNRAGILLLAEPNLRLQLGDRITVVGLAREIDKVSELLGNELKWLNNPNLLGMLVGIFLGCILGAIPLYLPGMDTPVRLGFAGGPIVVGILMGAFGPRFRIATYMTLSANLILRNLGIVMYLACLGLATGSHFVETLIMGDGLYWIFLGLILTVIPIVIMCFVSMFIFKFDYGTSIGMICGSMTNTMALGYITPDSEHSSSSSVAYATVYPLTTFVRIMSAQIIAVLFIT